MTLNDVIALYNWAGTVKEKQVSAKTAFRLAKLLNQYSDDYNTYNKLLTGYLNTAAKRDENGKVCQNPDGTVLLEDGKFDVLQQQLNELGGQEVEEPNDLYRLEAEDLSNLGKFSAVEMLSLMPFLKM